VIGLVEVHLIPEGQVGESSGKTVVGHRDMDVGCGYDVNGLAVCLGAQNERLRSCFGDP
jgi:hypothetical protein